MSNIHEDTEEELRLRRWLAGRLGFEDVPAPLWDRLKTKHYVADACDPNYAKGKDTLLEEARDRLRFHREMGSPNSSPESPPDPPDFPSEPDLGAEATNAFDPPALRARTEAALPYLLKRSEANWSVQDLRGRLEAPLPAERARSLIRPRDEKELPLSDIRRLWNGKQAVQVDMDRDPFARELLGVADMLHGPWFAMDMGWWILTGEPPRIAVIQAEDMGDKAWPTLTLQVPMWVPVDELGQYYKNVRRLPAVKELYNFSPTPSPRRLAVFRLVVEHSEFRWAPIPRRLKPSLSWRELMRLWNQRLPANHDWRYSSAQNFHRDFVRARDALFDYD